MTISRPLETRIRCKRQSALEKGPEREKCLNSKIGSRCCFEILLKCFSSNSLSSQILLKQRLSVKLFYSQSFSTTSFRNHLDFPLNPSTGLVLAFEVDFCNVEVHCYVRREQKRTQDALLVILAKFRSRALRFDEFVVFIAGIFFSLLCRLNCLKGQSSSSTKNQHLSLRLE